MIEYWLGLVLYALLVFILIADEGHIPLAADPFRGLLKNYAGLYNYNAIHVYFVLLMPGSLQILATLFLVAWFSLP